MKNSWVRIRSSAADLAILRAVAELMGADVSTSVHVMAREKWRRLVKAPPLPVPAVPAPVKVSSKARRSRA